MEPAIWKAAYFTRLRIKEEGPWLCTSSKASANMLFGSKMQRTPVGISEMKCGFRVSLRNGRSRHSTLFAETLTFCQHSLALAATSGYQILKEKKITRERKRPTVK